MTTLPPEARDVVEVAAIGRELGAGGAPDRVVTAAGRGAGGGAGAGGEQVPEGFGGVGSGDAAGHADDGDGLG